MMTREQIEDTVRFVQSHLFSMQDYLHDHRGRSGVYEMVEAALRPLTELHRLSERSYPPDMEELECEGVLRQDPKVYTLWAVLGLIRVVRQDYAGAREALELSLSLCKDYVPALVQLGQVLLSQRDPVRAERILKTAHAMQPQHTVARVLLAQSLCETGQAVDACSVLREGLQHEPSELHLWNAYYEAMKWAHSVKVFEEEVRERSLGNTSAMLVLAQLCFDKMRYIEAVDILQQLLPHHEMGRPYHLIAKTYLRLGMVEQARDHYARAMLYDLNNLELLEGYAQALFASGNDELAHTINDMAQSMRYASTMVTFSLQPQRTQEDMQD